MTECGDSLVGGGFDRGKVADIAGGIAGFAACFANFVRWWVIRTLGEHWNVQVMDSTKLGVITTGPFRYVRHPNYAAVFVEMIALPLIHTAWITALAGAIAHVLVLALRLSTEERVLFANPDYAAAMSSKPRFLPGLF